MEGKVAALFTGQGAQYVDMFSDVAQNWPEMRRRVSEMDQAFAELHGNYDRGGKLELDATVSELIYPRRPYADEAPVDATQLKPTQVAQPATVAVSLGCYDILANAGFRPDMVAGHSLGELSALHAAGYIDRDTLAKVVVRRGAAMASPKQQQHSQPPATAMVAILGNGAGAIEVPQGTRDVWVANKNGPSQVVVAGAAEAVRKFAAAQAAAGFRTVPLQVSNAFHTPFMAAHARDFAAALNEFKPALASSIEATFNSTAQNSNNNSSSSSSRKKKKQQQAPVVFSNVTGTEYQRPTARGGDSRRAAAATADAIVDNLRRHIESPVEFTRQIRNMHAAGARVFVEFGPRRALAKFAASILEHDRSSGGGGEVVCVAVNATGPKGADSEVQLRDAAVQLAVCGVPLPRVFDAWALPDPHTLGTDFDPASPLDAAAIAAEKKKTKTTLRLKASTYIAPRTLRKREAVMNDGYVLSGKVVSTADSDRSRIAELEALLARAQQSAAESTGRAGASHDERLQLSRKAAALEQENQRLKAQLEQAKKTRQATATVANAAARQPSAPTPAVAVAAPKYTPTIRVRPRQRQAPVTVPAPAPAPVTATTTSSASPSIAKMERVVLEVIAEKTGYDVDMVEHDASLEDDLGIDSIKRIELLAAIQDILGVEGDREALARTQTVGDVIDCLRAQAASSNTVVSASLSSLSSSAASVTARQEASGRAALSVQPHAGAVRAHVADALAAAPNVDLAVPELQRIPLPAQLSVSGGNGCTRPVLILGDDTALTTEVTKLLAQQGHHVVVVAVPSSSGSGSGSGRSSSSSSSNDNLGPTVTRTVLADVSEAAVRAVVDQHSHAKGFVSIDNAALDASVAATAGGSHAQALGLVVMFAKHLSPALRDASGSDVRNFFVCVTRLDGRLGFTSQFADPHTAGPSPSPSREYHSCAFVCVCVRARACGWVWVRARACLSVRARVCVRERACLCVTVMTSSACIMRHSCADAHGWHLDGSQQTLRRDQFYVRIGIGGVRRRGAPRRRRPAPIVQPEAIIASTSTNFVVSTTTSCCIDTSSSSAGGPGAITGFDDDDRAVDVVGVCATRPANAQAP